jgi:hypothetical protein
MAHDIVAWASRGSELVVEDSVEALGWTASDMPSLGDIPDHATGQRLAPNVHTYHYTIIHHKEDGASVHICHCVIAFEDDDLVVGFSRCICPMLEELFGLWPDLDDLGHRCLLDLATHLAR